MSANGRYIVDQRGDRLTVTLNGTNVIDRARLSGIPAAGPIAALWASDPLTKVLRSAKPDAAPGGALQLSGARREIASGQAVFRSPKEVAGAQASISDLRQRVSGAVIPSRAIRLQWVRYLDITRNSNIPADERVSLGFRTPQGAPPIRRELVAILRRRFRRARPG